MISPRIRKGIYTYITNLTQQYVYISNQNRIYTCIHTYIYIYTYNIGIHSVYVCVPMMSIVWNGLNQQGPGLCKVHRSVCLG